MPYEYEPISGLGESYGFRLVELIAADDRDLVLKIHVRSLASPPPYTALSYCWGSNELSEGVDVVGSDDTLERLPVTANLLLGLQGIVTNRAENLRDQLLWIDAICINQTDASEKEHQIPLMCDIYTKAEKTAVWLGKPAVAGADRLCRNLVDTLKQEHLADYMESLKSKPGVMRQKTEKADFVRENNEEKINSFAAMLRTPWFTRAWIAQEVVAAKEVLFLYGLEAFGWSECVFSCRIFQDDYFVGFHRLGEEKSLLRLNHVRESWHDDCLTWKLDFYNILKNLNTRHATLDRDYIYSLINIARDVKNLNILPDYSSTTSDSTIFVNFTCKLIESQRNLSILGELFLHESPQDRNVTPPDRMRVAGIYINRDNSVRRREREVLSKEPLIHGQTYNKQILDLPSWIPDWRLTMSVKGIADKARQLDFSAGGPESPRIQIEDNRLLHLTGTFLEIVGIGVVWPRDDENEDTVLEPQWAAEIAAFYALVDAHSHSQRQSRKKYRPTGERYADVFWQLLIAGVHRTRYKEMRKSFRNHPKIERLVEFTRNSTLIGDKKNSKINWTIYFVRVMLWALTNKITGKLGSMEFSRARHIAGRKIAVSDCGALSIVPGKTSQGDRLFFAKGCSFPIVVKGRGNGEYTLVGAAYTHGYMFGEVWETEKARILEHIALA